MDEHDSDILMMLDLLDLDESVVDERLKTLIKKENLSNKNLKIILYLLQYKYLINLKEDSECGNESEYEFIVNFLPFISGENVHYACNILTTVLLLEPCSLSSKAEHFLQQILSELELSELNHENDEDIFLKLKLTNSVLKAALKNTVKINLLFLDVPLENIVYAEDERLRNYFLSHIVPNFMEVVDGYNILDRIWKTFKVGYKNELILKILSSLSEYFIPLPKIDCDVKYKSNVIFNSLFWEIILFGLMSNQYSRKTSIYLAKRAIDACMTNKMNIVVKSPENGTLISWNVKDASKYKKSWDNYFILLESLEETQSNIVLASLQLFDAITDIERCWLNCIFKLGLAHDNFNVKLTCLEHRLKYNIENDSEATNLMDALNSNNFYDDIDIKIKLQKYFAINVNLEKLLLSLCTLKWSNVSLYYITDILSTIKVNNVFTIIDETEFTDSIYSVLYNPCNNIVIKQGIQHKIVSFVCKTCKNMHWRHFLKIMSKLDNNALENNKNRALIKEWLGSMMLSENEKKLFISYLMNSHVHINITIIYLNIFKSDIMYFTELLNEKIKNINDLTTRLYASKIDCFDTFIYLMLILNESLRFGDLNVISNIKNEFQNLSFYVQSLLANEPYLNMDQLKLFKNSCSILFSSSANKEVSLQLYKSSLLILKEESVAFIQKLMALIIINNLTSCKALIEYHKHEMLDIENFAKITINATSNIINDNENFGRTINKFYEHSCEILYAIICMEDIKNIRYTKMKLVIDYMEHTIECGGYGCLKWVLKIMNHILPQILQFEDNISFDVVKFIERSWKEIEELKSNNQYAICVKEFINIITNEVFLKNGAFNNIVLSYSSKIMEYSNVSNTELYFLTQRISNIPLHIESGVLIHVLCDILVFCPVLRKDQRWVKI